MKVLPAARTGQGKGGGGWRGQEGEWIPERGTGQQPETGLFGRCGADRIGATQGDQRAEDKQGANGERDKAAPVAAVLLLGHRVWIIRTGRELGKEKRVEVDRPSVPCIKPRAR